MNLRSFQTWATALAVAGALGFGAAALAQSGAPAGKPAPAAKPATAKAIFAGGCFWCMEPPYDKLDGVIATTSGYIGGKTRNPTYEQISTGTTGHTEVVQVEYDPKKISYEKLLEVFWVNTDPTVRNRQFCDVGTQYRTGIFFVGRRAAPPGGSIESEAGGHQAVQATHRDRDHRRRRVLARGGVSPGLLQEESGALQVLRVGVRTLRALEGALG